MKQGYHDRMMKARDPRFQKIAERLYGTRHMAAAPEPVEAPKEDLTELRAEYEKVVGKRAYHGWDADTLRAKIAEADDE